MLTNQISLYEYLLPAIFGLIGVVVGGLISFLIQLYFLKRESKEKRKTNLLVVATDLSDLLSSQITMFKTLISGFPDELPTMLWSYTRHVPAIQTRPVAINTEQLLSLISGDENCFNEAVLAINRFNSNLAHFIEFNERRLSIRRYMNTHSIATTGDLMKVDIDLQNPKVVESIYQIENMLRDLLKYLTRDIDDVTTLLKRVNKIWATEHSNEKGRLLELPEQPLSHDYLTRLQAFNLSDIPQFSHRAKIS